MGVIRPQVSLAHDVRVDSEGGARRTEGVWVRTEVILGENTIGFRFASR